MNIDLIENSFMLLAAILGLLAGLFRYIEIPKRGWLYVTVFFLAHFLSDYYWTTYYLVINDNPNISASIAYFGWNVGYLLLLIAVIMERQDKVKGYLNPLMLIPIPLNVIQFFIYIQFGAIINNLWQVSITTITSCICLQSILFYINKRRSGGVHFPYFHTLVFLYLFAEYGMWTASCFSWISSALNPYYYFAFFSYLILPFFAWAVGKDCEAEGLRYPSKSTSEVKYQILLQVMTSMIIIGCCVGGYFLALWMKNSLPQDMENEGMYNIIAITLFVISVFLVLLILAVMLVIGFRYKALEGEKKEMADRKRGRLNLFFTILVTLGLMIFSVSYTSRLFYRVSVTGVYGSGRDKAESEAYGLENYLAIAESTLNVTADTVDLMMQHGQSQKAIYDYLTSETENQSKHLDENFTGIYTYTRGDFMDGSGWIPPDDYDATKRDWYNEAIKANGETIIVSPYVDAQTQSVIITICRMISDAEDQEKYGGHNVVALDVIVNHIQETVENININEKGFGMVLNEDGMIIAHRDPLITGKNCVDVYGQELFDAITHSEDNMAYSSIDDEDHTLFIDRVADQWYVVIAVSNYELFNDIYSQLNVNVIVSLIIFGLITFFYYLSYKYEKAYDNKIDEMRKAEQEKEYAAQLLMLEKKAADEANKAKSSFLADMSHEIRTPINAILGMNEMILRETDDPGILEYSKNIGISGKNLLQIINSILDFSKIEDGKMEIVPVRYSVSDLITYLINSISERARVKGLELNINADPRLPSELFGDDTRINQVIMNLLTNAVKYTPEGSVTFTIKEKERDDEKVLIHVEVKDTGIGIRESDMKKLFESFERLDVVKNRNIEGTGLGMSITTKLLNLMDSELKVDSTYGEGSVFYFDLWQKIENPEPLGEYKPTIQDVLEEGAETGSFYAPDAYILLVDDTRMNILVAVNLLKRTGIRIDTAMSGPEAIELAGKNAYDVILLDQRMPGMDGTETLKKIRELESDVNKDTPVICLTADAIRGAKDRYIAQGFNDYLTKPVNGRSLEDMLLTYLPNEKILDASLQPDPDKENGASSDVLFAELQKIGVDTDSGLKFFEGNEKVYREVLIDYALDSAGRLEDMEKYYSQKDWDNYSIYVHSLKSSSKTIGAIRLSEMAAALEAASVDRNEIIIEGEHETAMKLYREIVAVVKANTDTDEAGIIENEDGSIDFF